MHNGRPKGFPLSSDLVSRLSTLAMWYTNVVRDKVEWQIKWQIDQRELTHLRVPKTKKG